MIILISGDSEHKPHVSSTPDIVSLQLDGDEDFVILACDGLWDSVTYEKAAQAVYNHVQSDPGKIKLDFFRLYVLYYIFLKSCLVYKSLETR